ncbi:DUF1015 domain-containing protein [Thiohalocapsa marina]|uniref:DUF1015 domain-containing protein n=1 Tax=Thiohalocapsa marina TaxID=424902 RepID=A0A5M8FD25_9GAMM|nr:DUF1015 family protein [Thiohalocapsa marina]KAA6182569.1 DUF1015 domain-containing protein [Thiohalocapsa marina]
MPLIKPFAGLRPAPGRAAEVAAPPYDVVTADEARRLVAGRPWSFLHVSRPEVDLPPQTAPYDHSVYARARDNLRHMLAQGVLLRDPAPAYYVYRLSMGAHRQTGLVAAASVAAYDDGRIRRHELTRPAKEDDRVRQIDALQAQTGPVLLVYRARAEVDALLAQQSQGPAEVDITAADGVRHELWVIDAADKIARIGAWFDAMEALYIADGHHRSAAASRVAAAGRAADPDPDPNQADARQFFLSVLFPHDQMQILPYNRVVRDLNGLEPQDFLRRVAERFQVAPEACPVQPAHPAEFGLYLDHCWYRLRLDAAHIPRHDPVRRLDVSLLQEHLIEPILGIADPRRDERIDFVGGIRGLAGLVDRVDNGDMRLALSLHPTSMDDLMTVADAGACMPPKSTWFEPKLADGLVSHPFDAAADTGG